MNTWPRWMAFVSIPAVLALHMAATQAFTDSNAEMKEAAVERRAAAAAVPVVAQAQPTPSRTAWVPASPKSLDGFRPVFADERLAEARRRATLLAQAAPAASAPR